MKIYRSLPFEGHYQVIGYSCKVCGLTVMGEDLPSDFIEEQGDHYCVECQVACNKCNKVFSVEYAEDYFNWGICENCTDTH